MDWMLLPFRRYAEFSGRSRRMEYWMFALLNVIVTGIGYALMVGGGGDLLASNYPAEPDLAWQVGPMFWIGAIVLLVWTVLVLVPSIAVSVRRLHDLNLTGWIVLIYVILSFIPVVNVLATIAYIVLMAWPGTKGANKYGPDPKTPGETEAFI